MAEGLTRGRLLRLAGELAQERKVAEGIALRALSDAARLAAVKASSDPDETRGFAASVALGLHRWYSAVESMIERVERTFETLPSGPNWQSELLEGAAIEIPELRPAILPEGQLDRLRELLRFRHFLRHAYAVELDAGRLQVLAADLTAVHASAGRAIETFEGFLVAAAHALAD